MNKIDLTHDVLATKGARFANYAIDMLLKYGIAYSVGLIIGLLYRYFNLVGPYQWITTMSTLEGLLFSEVISLSFYFIFEATTQRTPGKYITGTKVITFEGDKPNAITILKRTLCRMIPFNAFSFLGEPGKGWHDSITNTYVVNIKKYEEALQLKSAFDEIGAVRE
jgi:uncharacterized RDD family membrane protein YckC